MILSRATSTLERAITSIRSGEPQVCLLQAVGREVGYNIGNPEGSESEFDYSVDWGDGAKSSGRGPERIRLPPLCSKRELRCALRAKDPERHDRFRGPGVRGMIP